MIENTSLYKDYCAIFQYLGMVGTCLPEYMNERGKSLPTAICPTSREERKKRLMSNLLSVITTCYKMMDEYLKMEGDTDGE